MPITKRNLLLVMIFFAIGIFSHIAWQHMQHAVKEPLPPSFHYAKAILNDCEVFTTVGDNQRRAISVGGVGRHLDSGGNTWVDFKWKWVAGRAASDSSSHDAEAILVASPAGEWFVETVYPSKDESIHDACREGN